MYPTDYLSPSGTQAECGLLRTIQRRESSKETPLAVHAERMSCRYWVERALQNGKSQAKLDEYMVRSWRGWHHHMTMTLLAMLFLLKLQVTLKERAPRLTINDAREILEVVLPRKQLGLEEAVEYIRQKHQKRDATRRSHTLKNRYRKN